MLEVTRRAFFELGSLLGLLGFRKPSKTEEVKAKVTPPSYLKKMRNGVEFDVVKFHEECFGFPPLEYTDDDWYGVGHTHLVDNVNTEEYCRNLAKANLGMIRQWGIAQHDGTIQSGYQECESPRKESYADFNAKNMPDPEEKLPVIRSKSRKGYKETFRG